MAVVVVTGASGRLGRRVAELLLARRRRSVYGISRPGEISRTQKQALPAEDVVLVTRRPAAVADLAARGATVRAGDFDDPTGLAATFAGADGGVLLLVSTDALDRRVGQHRRAIEAAVAAGMGHVVYTSLSNPVRDNPVRVVTDAHRRTEETLVELAPRWTILRNATYADALLPLWRAAAAAGRLVTSQSDGRTAWVARDDCAAVAAAVLSDAAATAGRHADRLYDVTGPASMNAGDLARHAGQVYDVTGPELMDAADLADVLAAWSGRPVAVDAVDDEAMAAHLVAAGLAADRARLVTLWHRAVREGYFTQHTDVVERLTGHPGRTVADLLAAG